LIGIGIAIGIAIGIGCLNQGLPIWDPGVIFGPLRLLNCQVEFSNMQVKCNFWILVRINVTILCFYMKIGFELDFLYLSFFFFLFHKERNESILPLLLFLPVTLDQSNT
jgi:hypothetical protein